MLNYYFGTIMYFNGIFQSFKTLIFEIPAHKVGGREGGGPSPHRIY
jgi:hypothetical protein